MRRLVLLSLWLAVLLAACGSPAARSTGGDVMRTWKPVLYPDWAPFPLTPFPNFPPTAAPEPATGQSVLTWPGYILPPGVTPPVRASAPQDHPDYQIGLLGEMQVGSYTVRRWHDTWMPSTIVTISRGDEVIVQIEEDSLLVRMAGQDITGEGHPDVVVGSWKPVPMGAYSMAIYDLGPTVTQVLDLSPITCGDFLLGDACPCGGMFQDLDGDGIPEVIACDEAFYFRWNVPMRSYDCAPQQLVVLQYNAKRGYAPASHRFPDIYRARLSWLRKEAKKSTREPLVPGEGPPCAVMGLVLSYLYTGQPANAWEELDRRYDEPDKALWWVETLRIVADSELYEPVGSFPDVPLPDYYMLQLSTGCESPRGPIGVLQKGQDVCDPAVPQWDEWWLVRLLRGPGMLAPGEGLLVDSVDCGTDCGLTVFRFGDTAMRLGTIQLDTVKGFPGEVHRVNVDGAESMHWRLKGNLTWEPVSP
jgi:hypothetical protein